MHRLSQITGQSGVEKLLGFISYDSALGFMGPYFERASCHASKTKPDVSLTERVAPGSGLDTVGSEFLKLRVNKTLHKPDGVQLNKHGFGRPVLTVGPREVFWETES